jgi:hypothetical protein
MPNYPTAEELRGSSDLKEEDLYLDSLEMWVRIRALAGAYSNEALSKAYEVKMVQGRGGRQEQTSHLDTQRLEELQVLHGLVIPKFATLQEVREFAQRNGPAWQKLTKAIQDLSGLSDEKRRESEDLFLASGSEPEAGGSGVSRNGSGDHEPDIPSPAGA